jgi:LPS export ABC transporter protein LptC
VRRTTALLLLLLCLASWAWLSSTTRIGDRSTATPDDTNSDAGYAATGAELIETGVDGELLYRLRAQRIAQPGLGSDIELTTPLITYDQGPQGVWSLQAERGMLAADRQSMRFQGDVVAVRTTNESPPLTLRTEALQVDMQTQRADSDSGVRLDWGRSTLSAKILQADMKAGTISLRGEGRARLRLP